MPPKHTVWLWVRSRLLFLLMVMLIFSPAVLHPQNKLQYFRNAGWEAEWVTTAEHLVRELYDRSYAVRTVAQGVNAGDEPEVSFMSPCPSLFY